MGYKDQKSDSGIIHYNRHCFTCPSIILQNPSFETPGAGGEGSAAFWSTAGDATFVDDAENAENGDVYA